MANGDDPNKIDESTSATERNTEATEKNTKAKQDNKKSSNELVDKLIAERNAKKNLSDVEEEAYLRSQSNFTLNEKIEELDMRRIDAIRRLEELREKEIENRKRGTPLIKEEAEELRKLNETIGEEADQFLKVKKAIENTKKAKDALRGATEKLTGVQLSSIMTAKGLTEGMLNMAVSLDKASTSLAKTTGYTQAFRADMLQTARAGNGLFATLADGKEVTGGLITQFSLFAAQGEGTRRLVSDTTLLFKKLGVDVGETAGAFDVLTRGMGFSIESANRALHTFERLGQEIGVPTGQLVSDFNRLAPQIARFGQRADEVFRNLQRRARELGLTAGQVFQFADMADTFEGASDLAGKLNAQFGMQLNSMELMRAEGVERVDLLRKEFQARGMNFEQLHKRQKQMIAEIMGTDVQTASRLFGDPVELRKYQREQLEAQERAQKMVDMQTKFAALVEGVFLMLEKPLSVVLEILTTIANVINGSGGLSIVAGVLILKTAFVAAINVMRGMMMLPAMINRSTMAMNNLAIATNRAAAAGTRLNMTGGGGLGGMGGLGGGGRGLVGGAGGGGRGLMRGGLLGRAALLGGGLFAASKAFGGKALGAVGGLASKVPGAGRAQRAVHGAKGLLSARTLNKGSMINMDKYKALRSSGLSPAQAKAAAQLGKGGRTAALAAKGALAGARAWGPLGAAMEFAIYQSMGLGLGESLGRTGMSLGGAALGGAAAAGLGLGTGGAGALAGGALMIGGGLAGGMAGDYVFGDPFAGAAMGRSGIKKGENLKVHDGGKPEIVKIKNPGQSSTQVIPGVQSEGILTDKIAAIVGKVVGAQGSGAQKAVVTIPVTIDMGKELGGPIKRVIRKEIDFSLDAVN